MYKNIFVACLVVVAAFSILLISIMRATQIKFKVEGQGYVGGYYDSLDIPYQLAYPGKVLPNHFLWPVKAMRDKIWLTVTTDQNQRTNLLLLFADKRLASSVTLLEQNDYENSLTALVKAESYLERASIQEQRNRTRGLETNDTLRLLAYASLKHYDVINSMMSTYPDDARVVLIDAQNMPKLVYEQARDALNQKGTSPPENPFDW